jgi:hypothetical protein
MRLTFNPLDSIDKPKGLVHSLGVKKIYTLLYLCLCGGLGLLFAQTPLESLQSGYQQRREALVVKRELDEVNLRKSYHNALENLMSAAQARGDFSSFVEIENEVKRTKNTLLPAQEKSTSDALAKLQNVLDDQLKTLDIESAAALVDLHGKLDQALTQLQQHRLREGDVTKAKEIEGLRAEYRKEEKVAAAYALAPAAPQTPAPVPSAPVTNNTLALQKLKGKVTAYNVRTGEVEIVYDFSDKDQLKDFTIKDTKAFKIVDGQLVVTAPKGSDWFPTIPEMRSPWLTIPFIDSEDFEMEVEVLSVDAKDEFHLAWGVSNLKNRTLAMGPYSKEKTRGFRIEGWTPEQEIFRKSLSPMEFPSLLSVEGKGGKIEFGVKIGSKTERFKVGIDDSMPFPGLFPKSWGGDEATAVYDNLRIKGKFKPE